MTNLGIKCTPEQVITSAFACGLYLKRQRITGKVYVIGEQGTFDELESMGFQVIGKLIDDDDPFTFDDFDAQAVVLSFDSKINFTKLTKVCYLVSKLGERLNYVVTNPVSKRFKSNLFFYLTKTQNFISFFQDKRLVHPRRGLMVPDVGSFAALIKHCTGKKAVVMGKPTKWFFNCIKESTGKDINPLKVCMFGDTLATDIRFALNNRFRCSVLVKTGIDQIENVQRYRPTHMIRSLGDLSSLI